MRLHYHRSNPFTRLAMTILETESTLTSRYQTTIPDAVRKVLGLGKQDRLLYRVTDAGEVQLVKAQTRTMEDPALLPFLTLLDQRLQRRPDTVVPYTDADAKRDLALVKGVKAR
jgi:antitoxin PrlF